MTSTVEHRSLRFVGSPFSHELPFSPEELRRCLGILNPQDRTIAEEIVGLLEESGDLPFQWTPQEAHFVRSRSVEDVLGYLVYRYKFKVFPKEKRVADFPTYLLIEPISTCNLRCVMCFQVDKTFTRKPFMGMMDFDLYTKIIDEAAENGTRAITLASRGEPLLHPRIGEMLRYAHAKNCFFDIKLNTNGTKLTEALAHDILSSGVNIVVVSIDSTTPEEYEKIRVRGDFAEVLRNVRMLRRVRDKHYPDSQTEIRVSGVKILEDQSEEDFGAFWTDIADTVAMVKIIPRWDTYANPVHEELASSCEYLWERMYVWFDGTCNPCDADYKSVLTVGAYPDVSLRDVWHSAAYTELRDKHKSGDRLSVEPCDRCGVGG